MIVALEEAKRRLLALADVLAELGNQLRIEEAREKASELERETLVQDFWNDAEKSSKKLQEIKQLKDKVEGYEELVTRLEDATALWEVAIEENDESSVEEVVSETDFIETEAENKRIEVLLSGPYDKNNAILSIHPGAGGTEAQDWCEMLYRMYTRWAERRGDTVTTLDFLEVSESGYAVLELPETEEAKTKHSPRGTSLPSKYDLRDVNGNSFLPPTVSQDKYGTCWAFSASTAASSNSMVRASLPFSSNTSILSPLHLAYFGYGAAYDELGMLEGDTTSILDKKMHYVILTVISILQILYLNI